MIEINLLPGGTRRKKSAGAGLDIRALVAGIGSSVKDPFLVGAVAGVIVGLAAIAFMFIHQSRREEQLTARLEKAQADSTRFAAVLKEQARIAAKRDSVARSLRIIRAIDNNRYVWPHLMDEVATALPPYTWLTSLEQTSVVVSLAARQPDRKPAAGAATSGTSGGAVAEPDEGALEFRIVGNTVDIQALTRFMKTLESSPFIRDVRLRRSEMTLVDGKDVTEFELDGSYESPPASVIRTVPLSQSVR